MDNNMFSELEISRNEAIFDTIEDKLSEFLEHNPDEKDDVAELLRSFNDLRGLYGKGKKVWYDQHRLTFQHKLIAPGFYGARNYIANEFNRLFTILDIEERLMVSEYQDQKFAFLIYNAKDAETNLNDIRKSFAEKVIEKIPGAGTMEYQLNDRKDVMLISFPNLTESTLFRLSIKDRILNLELLESRTGYNNTELMNSILAGCAIEKASKP